MTEAFYSLGYSMLRTLGQLAGNAQEVASLADRLDRFEGTAADVRAAADAFERHGHADLAEHARALLVDERTHLRAETDTRRFWPVGAQHEDGVTR
jgi:hypothetical protein